MISQCNNSHKTPSWLIMCCLALLITNTHLTYAQILPPLTNIVGENNVPGGIIDFKLQKLSTDLPEIKYGLHEVTIIDKKSYWQVLIGIGLETIPGEYLLYVKHQLEDSVAFSQKFQVRQQPVEFITPQVANSQVLSIEHDNFSDIKFENTAEPTLPLRYPSQGHWANYFGHIHTKGKNIKSRNFISMTTTALATVTAPQNAIVSRIIETPDATRAKRNNHKANYTIFLDHGRGLYSVLTGVSDLTIEVGNGVLAGAVLGKIHSNDTTNSKPRTLIWQTVLNKAYVNPVILTQ